MRMEFWISFYPIFQCSNSSVLHHSKTPLFQPVGYSSFLVVRMSDPIVVLVTCSSEEEAYKIAGTLVEERLAACVNILSSIRSIYRWEGKICDDRECLLIVKTDKQRFEDLEQKVKVLHSYSVPEIIALPIVRGSLPYLKWLTESVLP